LNGSLGIITEHSLDPVAELAEGQGPTHLVFSVPLKRGTPGTATLAKFQPSPGSANHGQYTPKGRVCP
jgi:hypothetical protein